MCDTSQSSTAEAALSAPRLAPGSAVDPIALQPVDEVSITVLMDNTFDGLLPSNADTVRAGFGPPVAADHFTSGHTHVGLLAEHGFSALVTVRRGQQRTTLLFDAGLSPTGILSNADQLGLRFDDVQGVILSHGHFDHAGGAAQLSELTGAPIVARDPALCVAAEPLRDDVVQHAAGVEWLTVLTPGHSSDSICLVLPHDRALLTGDTILGRGTTVVAHPDGRLADYLDSLRRLRDLAETDVDVLLPGHGPVLDAPVETLDYYLRHREERLDQVRGALADGATDAADVVRRVYADVYPGLWPAAESSVRAQMDYLARPSRP